MGVIGDDEMFVPNACFFHGLSEACRRSDLCLYLVVRVYDVLAPVDVDSTRDVIAFVFVARAGIESFLFVIMHSEAHVAAHIDDAKTWVVKIGSEPVGFDE